MGTNTSTDNLYVMENAEVVFLCVKPHILPEVLDQISITRQKHHLFISVAAGVRISFLEEVGFFLDF